MKGKTQMKPVQGYEGRYSVSDDGRVYSHVTGKIREHTGKPVDRDALLALADKLECDGECDGCDMSDGIWCDAQGYAARRIREACGMDDAG